MSDSDIDNTEDFPRVSEEAETDNDETTDVLAFWVMVDDNVEMDDSDNKEMMVNLDGEAEIHDEGELFKCISILQEAQVEVQRIEAKNNCPHCYTGNSKRTKQRHALQWQNIAEDPKCCFITNFFKLMKRKREEMDSNGGSDVKKSDAESVAESMDEEIEKGWVSGTSKSIMRLSEY